MLRELKNTIHNRTVAKLRVHKDIMDSYITEGWDWDEASKQAMVDLEEMTVKEVLFRAAELRHSKPLI